MRMLGIALVLGIVLPGVPAVGAPSIGAPPVAAKVRTALVRTFPGARVTYDDARGLRRIAGIRLPLASSVATERASAVLSRVAPATWPGLDLQTADVRVETSRSFSRIDAGLMLEGRPVLDARMILEVRLGGTLAAVSASLPPVIGIVRPEHQASDDVLRQAACAAIRAQRPDAPCPIGNAVRPVWYRTPDGMLRAGALVSVPSPTLVHAPEVLVDAAGEALWTRDRARR